MPRTRSSKTAAPSGSSSTTDNNNNNNNNQTTTVPRPAKYTLQSTSQEASPKLFVLPKAAGPDACIVTLPNPRYSKPTRYLVCPETGDIYEFTKIAAPGTDPRSWLLAHPGGGYVSLSDSDRDGGVKARKTTMMGVQVAEAADLYVATPFDPLFLLLPALVPASASSAKVSSSGSKQQLFLSSEDHFDTLPTLASHLSQILLQWEKVRSLLEGRMGAVCDTVEAGDQNMFRLNEKKLLHVLLAKARNMSEPSLPASMEDRFIKKALEAPLVQRKAASTTTTVLGIEASISSGSATPVTELSAELQSSSVAITEVSASTTTTTVAIAAPSSTSIANTSPSESNDAVSASMAASAEIVGLQRLRTAFDFILSAYVPPVLAERLRDTLDDYSQSSVDFSSLDDYLKQVSEARTEALALRSMADYTQKHGRDEDEDGARLDKRQKLEEEKKKKSVASHGIKQLAKVDTSGMKKLSHFFAKK